MSNVMTPSLPQAPSRWRDLVLPKEHGSWSLAFEPVALGLLTAPSFAGVLFGVGVAAAFFVRRPLRIAIVDARAERRAAARGSVAVCASAALAAVVGACVLAGVGWLVWLLPSAIAGAVFLGFDLRQSGREQEAELAGTAAFAWLPAAFAILAGWSAGAAAALAAVMLARAVPTVLCLRTLLRTRKTGTSRVALPLAAALIAFVGVLWLVGRNAVPLLAAVAVGVLGLRALIWLVYPRPALRASTMGMIEAGLGVAFVAVVALTWPS